LQHVEEHRLDRIEQKLNKLTEAVSQIAEKVTPNSGVRATLGSLRDSS